MKIDVIEQKKNPFLKRTDLMLMIDHTGSATPKEEELKKEIAQKFKSGPDHVEVVYIFTQAGIAKSKVKSRIWVGKAPVKVKKPKVEKPKEEPKPEEKPKEEAKPEEKKPEEKAEEKKVEEKPKEEVKPKLEEKPKEKPKEKPPEKPPEKKEEPKKLEKPPKKKEGEKK